MPAPESAIPDDFLVANCEVDPECVSCRGNIEISRRDDDGLHRLAFLSEEFALRSGEKPVELAVVQLILHGRIATLIVKGRVDKFVFPTEEEKNTFIIRVREHF